MKPADIISWRLHNLLVSSPISGSPADVLRQLCASQAQDYAGAKWALGLRLAGSVDSLIEQAFNSGTILRTHVLRPTWHFVLPEDIGWLLELTRPQVHQINSTMYRRFELDEFVFEECNHVLAAALEEGRQLTRDELGKVLAKRGINVTNRQRLAYILMQAELNGLICSGGRRGRQFTYALLGERAHGARRLSREQALAELAGRYFHSRGPATVYDFAKWSGLTLREARQGLDSIKEELQQIGVEGQQYWYAPQTTQPANTPERVYLLSVYDELISSYKDHPAASYEAKERLIAPGNALQNVILVDGQIAGTWRRILKKEAVHIEIHWFRREAVSHSQAMEQAVQRYGEFQELPVKISFEEP